MARGMQDPVLQVKVSMGQEDIVKDIKVPGRFKQMLAPVPEFFNGLINVHVIEKYPPTSHLNLPKGYFFESLEGRTMEYLLSLKDSIIQFPVLPSLESPSPGT